MKSCFPRGIPALVLALVLQSGFFPTAARAQFFFLNPPRIGNPAPDFKLKTLGGREMTLSEYRAGKKAVVFFWATWCPHCRVALKDLAERRAEFEQKGVSLALVDLGESPEVVRRYMERQEIGLDVFLDETRDSAGDYGVVGLPTFFFVDEAGIIRSVQHDLPAGWEALFGG
jgi:peroxiredoxin